MKLQTKKYVTLLQTIFQTFFTEIWLFCSYFASHMDRKTVRQQTENTAKSPHFHETFLKNGK